MDRELYPNIKIIKVPPDKFNEGRNLYRYLLVCGFIKDKPPFVSMRHCPFCGTNLFEFYTSDNYINGNYDDF